MLRIAVASGKGGTGKTTVATNLAVVAASEGRSVAFLDCDVEEPNGALFLKPRIKETRPVQVSVPQVNLSKCTGCGNCREICQYKAIVPINKQVLLFPGLPWMRRLLAGLSNRGNYRVISRYGSARAG